MTSVREPPANGWAEDFSYDYYCRLLEALQERFEVRPLSAYGTDESDRLAVLRHDVDLSPARALELARVERDLGVRSTYMVLPETPLYSVEDEVDRLAAIRDLGHELGLHVTPDAMEGSRSGWRRTRTGDTAVDSDAVDAQRRRLESLGLGPITSVSFHLPPSDVLRGPETVGGLLNAYGCDLMGAYLSDSAGRWREGPPVERVRSLDPGDRNGVVQLLTHPIWWGETHEPPLVRYLEFVAEIGPLGEETIDELSAIYPPAEPYVRELRGSRDVAFESPISIGRSD